MHARRERVRLNICVEMLCLHLGLNRTSKAKAPPESGTQFLRQHSQDEVAAGFFSCVLVPSFIQLDSSGPWLDSTKRGAYQWVKPSV